MRIARRVAVLAGLAAILCAFDSRAALTLEYLGRYGTGKFAVSALEIAAYDAASKRLFVVNGTAPRLEVLDLRDPANPAHVKTLRLDTWGAGATSVAFHDGVAAVAIEHKRKTEPGTVAFFDAQGTPLGSVPVGPLPDMVAWSPDGRWVLTANEGEPSANYKTDPEGSISVIDVAGGLETLGPDRVRTAGFDAIAAGALDPSVRVFGPGATPAQDFEPEYIAVAPDSKTAYVTLQENNALAVVDIPSAAVKEVVGLGFKDWSAPGNVLDPSDKDSVLLRNAPVFGMYQPDAIAAFETGGALWLITANEGDARDYDGFSEEVRVADLTLDAEAFPDAGALQDPKNLGRLRVTNAQGDTDGDGAYEALYAFGGRSFSIWDASGALVYDSGGLLEIITAREARPYFNSHNEKNDSRDSRSDDKGPEPEGVTVGVVDDVPYVFLGLERIGGVMVFDLSDPKQPAYVTWVNRRDFAGDPEADTASELGPEGVLFIPKADSPVDTPLLVVTSEVSGSVAVYAVK